MIFTGLLFGIYIAIFLFTFVRNLVYIKQLSPKERSIFIFSAIMVFVCIGTVLFGVYSPMYTNGHGAVFFIGLFNLYVWALIYINWPMDSEYLFNFP
jgi:hypothetical protein